MEELGAPFTKRSQPVFGRRARQTHNALLDSKQVINCRRCVSDVYGGSEGRFEEL